ncbi:MAG: hypothetical protein RL698_1789, partial [Pseudomonadota bacterium]
SLLSDKASAFTRFPEPKPSGTRRVCAFGDSFTYGQETAVDHDYPSFLQRQFDREARARVEVLNFGSPWHGFGQSFFLWDRLAKRFGCDHVLIGPGSFFPGRDTTFNHSEMRAPGYLHARWVLEGDDVRLARVEGGWEGESRLDGYLSFVPYWRYLRYDRNPPPVILAALPRGRTVSNPFYYSRDPIEREATAIYRALWRKMAKSGLPTLLLHENRGLVRAANDLQELRLRAYPEEIVAGFPYRAPEGHRSAWGNELVARQFHSLIVGSPSPSITVLKTEDLDLSVPAAAANATQPLSDDDDIALYLRDRVVGVFAAAEGSESADFKSPPWPTKILSLLALDTSESSLVDACWLPLDDSLDEDTEVVLVRADIGDPREGLRWIAKALPGAIGVGVVSLPGLKCDCRDSFSCEPIRGAPPVLPADMNGAVALRVGGREVMRGTVSTGRIVLTPTRGTLRMVRAPEGSYGDVDLLPESGTFDLVVRRQGKAPTRTALVRWKKVGRPSAARER